MSELIDSVPWWWALPACILLSLVYILDVRAERARNRRRARIAAHTAELVRLNSKQAARLPLDARDLALLDRLRNARRSPVV